MAVAYGGVIGGVALFVVVVLGNVGVPLPEETVLALAGYLVWRGDMRLAVVLAVLVIFVVRPVSALLALVMAFAGVEETRKLSRTAIAERYRFYSFGDAMLDILARDPKVVCCTAAMPDGTEPSAQLALQRVDVLLVAAHAPDEVAVFEV